MKLAVKLPGGSYFEIRVQPSDTVMALKKNIEDIQGTDSYPCGQRRVLLIHKGKVLKDETTLADNRVSENDLLVVMLSKPASSAPSVNGTIYDPIRAPEARTQALALKSTSSFSDAATDNSPGNDTYSEVASKFVTGNDLEETIQLLMGAGNWDKETVTRALRAANNNPEQALDYLYSRVPELAKVAVPVAHFPTSQTVAAPVAPVSGAPNSSPLNMFPQEPPSGAAILGRGPLDFLRTKPTFAMLRFVAQEDPEMLQLFLQDLEKKNSPTFRLIQENYAEFNRLLHEPLQDFELDLFDRFLAGEDLPFATDATPAEEEAIERLQTLGFDRRVVVSAFLACERNEDLTAGFLLENAERSKDFIGKC